MKLYTEEQVKKILEEQRGFCAWAVPELSSAELFAIVNAKEPELPVKSINLPSEDEVAEEAWDRPEVSPSTRTMDDDWGFGFIEGAEYVIESITTVTPKRRGRELKCKF